MCTVGVGVLAVSYVAPGTCSLTAQVAAGTDYTAASGTTQTFTITPKKPATTNHHQPARQRDLWRWLHGHSEHDRRRRKIGHVEHGHCVTASGLTVSYVGVGTCSLNAQVAAANDCLSSWAAPRT